MPGATPAGGTGVEPAGSSAWRRASGKQLVEVEVAALGDPAHALLDHGERGRVLLEAHAEGPRQTRGGEVVVRGAQTAADDEQVGLGGERVAAAPP